ncbi:MAG: YfhO family protein [Bryobacteraceae bacterium]
MRRWLTRRMPIPVLSLIATWAFFCEYVPPFKRVHLFSDIEVYHYPLQRYAFQALKEGRFPQWDPSMYCGISFAGNIQAAVFYPPMWLVYAANWHRQVLPFKALEYFAFAHVWLAFMLCYGWLRARRLGRFVSVMGGGVFAFGGYMLWQIVHLGVATAMPWMPLAFWGIDEAVERRDWHPLWKTALASALWFLAGYPPSWLAFCATILVYALASRARWRAVAGVTVAVAASLLLSMVQFLPMLEAQSSAFSEPRYVGETRWAIIPLLVANWLDFSRGSSMYYLNCMYLYWGLAAIFAVIWGAGRRDLRPYRQPVVVMAVGLFLVLDPHAVVYYTVMQIPGLESAAQSYNFYEGVAAMAALVTAIGISDFLEKGPRRAAPRWLMPVAVVAMAAWSVRQLRIWAQGGAFATGGRAVAETAIALALFAIALWTLRTESGARRAWVAAAVMLFALCDYKVYGTNRLFNTRDGDVDNTYNVQGIRGVNDTAYQALWTNRDYRVTSDGSPGSVDFRTWGLATPQGLDPFLPKRYRAMIVRWGAHFQTHRVFLMDYRNEQMLQTLGVRYAITYRGAAAAPFLAASPNFRLLGQDDSFYRVYEYLHARPPFGWDGTPGDARPTGWMPERRAFQVRSERGGRFGLVEQFFPGWKATVDGSPVTIERWREAFQSIQVGPGEHTVMFEYHSRWLLLGAAISLASLAGLVWVIRST